MGERARKAVEYGLGGLLGFGVGVGLIGLGHNLLQALGADPMVLWIVLATAGTGFGYGCVRAGIALVGALSLYLRLEFLRRARRWEELVPLVRELVEDAEWINGFDHRVTMERRTALLSLLLRVERFGEAAEVAAVNARRTAGKLGAAHPDTVTANEVAEALRQAARDPAVAESVRRVVRRAVPQDLKR